MLPSSTDGDRGRPPTDGQSTGGDGALSRRRRRRGEPRTNPVQVAPYRARTPEVLTQQGVQVTEGAHGGRDRRAGAARAGPGPHRRRRGVRPRADPGPPVRGPDRPPGAEGHRHGHQHARRLLRRSAQPEPGRPRRDPAGLRDRRSRGRPAVARGPGPGAQGARPAPAADRSNRPTAGWRASGPRTRPGSSGAPRWWTSSWRRCANAPAGGPWWWSVPPVRASRRCCGPVSSRRSLRPRRTAARRCCSRPARPRSPHWRRPAPTPRSWWSTSSRRSSARPSTRTSAPRSSGSCARSPRRW